MVVHVFRRRVAHPQVIVGSKNVNLTVPRISITATANNINQGIFPAIVSVISKGINQAILLVGEAVRITRVVGPDAVSLDAVFVRTGKVGLCAILANE